MSYDPSGFAPDQPPPGLPPLDMPDVSTARARVQLPAIFLMIVGGLNFLMTLYFIGNGIYTATVPAQQLWEQTRETQASVERLLGAKGAADNKTPDEVKTQALLVSFAGAGLTGLCALLTVLGGWRMYTLRSYGLSIVGAVAAAIPCLSVTACCGLGEIVGLWAVIVLAKPEVREAFR
jgi:hypothetical protein